MRRAFLSCGLALALPLWACDPGLNLPEKPELIVDRLTLDFGGQVGEATYVNTDVVESLQIQNGGLNKLTLQPVTKTGDAVFTLTQPLSLSLESRDRTFLQVDFKPTAPGTFQGDLVINSDATSTADHPAQVTVHLTAVAVADPPASP